MQDRLGIHLSDTDITGIETIRDLLRLSIERRTRARALPCEEPAVALDIEHWLAPTGKLLVALGFVLYVLNWLVMRVLFRLRFTGVERLPETGPFLITQPRQLSGRLGNCCGAPVAPAVAGLLVRRRAALVLSPLARLFSRAVHLFPIDVAASRCGAQNGCPGAAVRHYISLVSRGLALSRRKPPAIPARYRLAADAQRSAGCARVYRGRI